MASVGRNPRLLCGFHALHMTLFPISIMTLFWKHRIGMSMTEILVVQGIFGLTMALFEFPSGYLADRIGYRRSLVWASGLGIVGWALYSGADDLAAVVVAESVLGVSIALASGCDSALLYESLRDDGREHEFARWTGRVRFWGQTGEGSAALLAGALYVAWPRLPFLVQAAVSAANLVVALALVEPARHLAPAGQHWQQVRGMLRHVFVDDRQLAAVVALTIVLGMSSFVPVWLVPLYATDAGVPALWIGPIWAVANYTVAIGSLLSERVARGFGLMPMLAGCIGLIAAGYAGLAWTHALFGFAWYFCLTSMRGLFGPALHHQENRLIPSSDRAGYLSLRSMLFRLIFLALGPAVGAAVDARGQHATLLVLGTGFVAAASGCWWWLRGQLGPAAPDSASK
jgi:MFS family permease